MPGKKLIFSYFIIGMISMTAAILFTGFFTDPEDGEGTLFIKHRPALKCRFYSPVAFHRLHSHTLTAEEKIDEAMFREFVINRHIIEKGTAFPIIPGALLQVCLTCLLACLLMYLNNMQFTPFLLMIHFLLNVMSSAYILFCMAFIDESVYTFLFFLLLVAVNFFSLRLLKWVFVKLNPTV